MPSAIDTDVIGGSSSGTYAAAIDSSHPYFLSPSDVPGITLVPTPFDGSGYGSWSRGMLMSLSAHNKIGFIDGSCPKPSANSPLLKSWERCNNLVGTWILSALSKQIASSVIYSRTAKEMWDNIKERYGQSNGAKIYQLKKDLIGVSQGNDDIATYYSRMKELWDELSELRTYMVCRCCDCVCTCEAKTHNSAMEEDDRTYQFLMGLNDSYMASRGNILMMSPFPSLAKVYSLLIHEEKQREVQANAHFLADSASLHAGTLKSATHFPNFPPQRQSSAYKGYNNNAKYSVDFNAGGKREDMYCRYCRKSGHLINRCPKLRRSDNQSQSRPYNQNNQRGNKSAAVAYNPALDNASSESSQPMSGPSTSGSISQDQMNQVMQLLQGVQLNSQDGSTSEGVAYANLAGPFSEEAIGNW